MAGIITIADHATSLKPIVSDFWGDNYPIYDKLYEKVFENRMSKDAYEIEVGLKGMTYSTVKPESTDIDLDSFSEGFKYTYLHVPYGNGFEISHEALSDEKHLDHLKWGMQNLLEKHIQTEEVVGANLFNNAFNSSFTFADGLELCSTAKLLAGGGTASNKLSTDGELSEASVEDMIIQLRGQVDERGIVMRLGPKKILVPEDLEFDIQRILESKLQPGNVNNDSNILNKGKYMPEGYVVNPYLTSASAYFIITDCMNGFRRYEREAANIDVIPNELAKTIRVVLFARSSMGCSDSLRAVIGSQGDGS